MMVGFGSIRERLKIYTQKKADIIDIELIVAVEGVSSFRGGLLLDCGNDDRCFIRRRRHSKQVCGARFRAQAAVVWRFKCSI